MPLSEAVKRQKAIDTLAGLLSKVPVAMLTTVSEDGSLWSRPITPKNTKFNGDLWFVTRLDSPKAREMIVNQAVSLTYASPEQNVYVSIYGTAYIVSDQRKAAELWCPSYGSWFPGGPSDPNLAIIWIKVVRAEYWQAPPMALPTEAATMVLAPEHKDDPAFHARIAFCS